MIKSIIRFVCGTYKVKIEGNATERFLTKLINTKYKVWNICKADNTLSFECYSKSYSDIIALAEQFEVSILLKRGLPLIFARYKKRYGLLIGTLVFCLAFYILTLFVWEINVVGCDKISAQEVLTRLKSNGFETGLLKSSLKLKEIENSFLIGNDKISWISINIKGTTATVEIREKEEKTELIDTAEPCNIYASRDGVIASVKAYLGYNVVTEGDTVRAGDLIVSGEYTDKYGKEYKLHSYASVMAYTTHSYSVKVPFKATEQQKTGKFKNFYKIKLIRFSIPLYFDKKISYNTYSVNKSVKKFSLGNGLVLPFWIEKEAYSETEKYSYTKTKDAALTDAYEQLMDYENNLVGIVVNDREYEITEDADAVTVKVLLDCYEDIGIQKKIS